MIQRSSHGKTQKKRGAMLTQRLFQGAICLDILGSGWSPVGTIKTALLSLRMLLEAPNPKDPQDAEVAKMMMDDHEFFECVAHDWAVKHAGAPRKQPPPDQHQRKTTQKKEDDIAKYVWAVQTCSFALCSQILP